ncbi:hypothetical protein TSAR_009160 [Trichomalopsis sarcophagae]|uniref:Major facilitator superfamily (MFS) profile domain-containing protein n=1 Tax=Trichomalopsis sarcophagae TaxID=543379 RepID=A0A232ENE8_9HYME|nr:hypothetical protein TSAR_009160 [Trichomalopsis sarcophagae]
MSLKMKAEEAKVGGYQILTLLLLSVNLIIVAMSHVIGLFYKYTPEFYCQALQETAVGSSDAASTSALLQGSSSGGEHVTNRTYGCVPSCPGGYLFTGTRDNVRSVAMEWQLVCEREYLTRTATEVYYVGGLLGGLVAGILADRIGRLPVLAMCLYAQGTMAVALYVIQEYQLFLVFRGLQAFFVQGLESCTFILCMELFPAKFRTLIALVVLSMRAFGMAVLAGLSYAVADWRILQLVVSVPTAVTVFYIWLIPESPRWLLARNKLTEAEMVLDRIAHYNGLICGGSSSRASNSDESENKRRSEKPQKPKRKTRATVAADADDNTKSTDVEKSLEESENLLPADTEQAAHGQKRMIIFFTPFMCSYTAHKRTSAEEKNVEEMINMNREQKSDLPPELSMEEIDNASLMVLASASNEKAREGTGPSYLLVSREALSADKNPKAKAGMLARNFIKRFLDSKFIGPVCAVQMGLWFCSSTAFHSLVTLPNRLSAERHVSLTLAAGMEIVAFVVTFLMVSSRFGRRRPLCVLQILVGVAVLAVALLLISITPDGPTQKWLAYAKVAVVSVGRFSNIACFFILRLVVIELFPTISRGTGLGLCIAAEMMGGLLLRYLSMLNTLLPELSRFIIGLLCVSVGSLSLLFPETRHEILPDTAADARSLGKRNNEISDDPVVLREKLFSEDWVDAGNGIIVNFTDSKSPELSVLEAI